MLGRCVHASVRACVHMSVHIHTMEMRIQSGENEESWFPTKLAPKNNSLTQC